LPQCPQAVGIAVISLGSAVMAGTGWLADGERAKCDIVAGGRGAPQGDQRRKLTAPRVLGTAYVKPMREP